MSDKSELMELPISSNQRWERELRTSRSLFPWEYCFFNDAVCILIEYPSFFVIARDSILRFFLSPIDRLTKVYVGKFKILENWQQIAKSCCKCTRTIHGSYPSNNPTNSSVKPKQKQPLIKLDKSLKQSGMHQSSLVQKTCNFKLCSRNEISLT